MDRVARALEVDEPRGLMKAVVDAASDRILGCAVLAQGLERATQGHGSLTLLLGDAGDGKTRLAEELSERATAAGAFVLWGRCQSACASSPFWLWTQLPRPLAEALTTEDVQGHMSYAAAQLAVLLQEIGGRLPGLPSPRVSQMQDPGHPG